MRIYSYMIAGEEDGMKILDFLRGKQGFSHGLITRLKRIPDGILKDGVHARTIDRLSVGEVLTIRVYDESPKEIVTSYTAVEPVYEDEDVLVFDKPPYTPVHQSRWHQADTLANVYAGYCERHHLPLSSFRPVNRLDKDTSGLVAVAKNSHAAAFLSGRIQKEYLAVAEGTFKQECGVIDAPVGREYEDSIRRCVTDSGQRAVTKYTVLRQSGTHALVLCRLETGRTHQIRVHFSYLGHPLAGDLLYGGNPDFIGRQALHCHQLLFFCPQQEKPVTVTAEIPPDIRCLYCSTGLAR